MNISDVGLRVECTNKCNLRCDYCLSLTSEEYRNRPETNFEALARFIEALKINRLFLIGGEICFYYRIEALMRFCRKKNIIVGTFTNGTLLKEYLRLIAINRELRIGVSYNQEGHPQRLNLCDQFIEQMPVCAINILVNDQSVTQLSSLVERFSKLKKIEHIKLFSDEDEAIGPYQALFESLVEKYPKVYIHDFHLRQGLAEKVATSRWYGIVCNHPLSIKGNSISFCKNIENFGMDITQIDFTQQQNINRLQQRFDDFQEKIQSGEIEYCRKCRFKTLLNKEMLIANWMETSLRQYQNRKQKKEKTCA